MEVHQRGLITGILMAALAISPLAEAKRAGGGKSHGMARSTTSSQSYQQPRQVTPVQQPATTAPQRSGPGVGSMVAAGVAGAAVGAVAANALADDKSTSAEHQVTQPGNEQAVQAQEEKRWYSWLALGITCSRCSFLCIP